MAFENRRTAGAALAPRLVSFTGPDTVVVGLPRGGVPVAAEVARRLGAPLDVLIVRKVGVPFHREVAMGAVGEDGVTVRNDDVIRHAAISEEAFARAERNERDEVERRAARFRRNRPRPSLAGATVVIVDDGIATGATALAAVQVARRHGAGRVVVATPVASPEACALLGRVADDVIVLQSPADFVAVGRWYRDFSETSDDEVERILAEHTDAEHTDIAAPAAVIASGSAPPQRRDEEVEITGPDGVTVQGHLHVPDDAWGTVVFAHGSGSNRFSHRNIAVADVLQAAGIATLLIDLLTEREATDRDNVFDIDLLAARLLAAAAWLGTQPDLAARPVGYFGASTGGAAALVAAATPGATIAALVSRGGRPDLAGSALERVHAPTLLIVGGDDTVVLGLNRLAAARLGAPHRLAVIPGATHLFEEAGALEEVASLAVGWFRQHFTKASATAGAHAAPGRPPKRDQS